MSAITAPHTLADVVHAVPEVQALLDAAQQMALAARHDGRFCRERAWKFGYAEQPALKPWLQKLVGWSSPCRGWLVTEAYDLVFDRLMSTIPQCRACG